MAGRVARKISALSIRAQLTLLALVVAAPAAVVMVQTSLSARAAAIRDAEGDSQRLVELIAGEQQRLVAGAQQLFVALSQLPGVRDRDARVQPVLAEVLRQSGQYASLFAVDQRGDVWASATPVSGVNVGERRYFTGAATTRRLSSGDYVVGRVSGKPVLPLAYPLVAPGGEFAGALVLGIDLSLYRRVLDAAKLPLGSSFLLFDREGTVLARGLFPERVVGTPDRPELRQRMLEGGDTDTFVATAVAGDERIISYRKLRLPGEAEPYLYVRAGIPLAAVLRDANRALVLSLGLLLAFLAIAILLASWLGRRLFADRIALLRQASQRMAGGDLEVRVAAEVSGGDLGSLGVAFDTLAQRLGERERALRQSERYVREILDATREAIFVLDSDSGRIVELNRTAGEMFGFTRAELMGSTVGLISAGEPPGSEGEALDRVRRAALEGPQTFEWRCRRRGGELFWAEVVLSAITVGGEGRLLAVARDLTDRKRAEAEGQALHARLAQAEKLESIGRLAGGVAHDINNMLSVILGEADLLKSQLAEDDPRREGVLQIEGAGTRSRDITRQLLAFSRRQPRSPRRLDLNAAIEAARRSLLRLVGEDIEVRFLPGSELWPVRLDPSQVDQILVNLATNARDAMASGGKLTIETRNVVLDEAYCRGHPGAVQGPHVALTISDQGTGMTSEVLSRVFEPFFSSKETGKGTGLGLATVYGIVEQNHGYIQVASEPGVGTSFRLHFPRDETSEPLWRGEEPAPAAPGEGTVLLVEDDARVRSTTARMLQSLGYRVTACAGPQEALSAIGQAGATFDVLLSDVVMPQLSGPELYRRLQARRPGLPVLFMSGHTSDPLFAPDRTTEGPPFIQKPFELQELARRLRDVLAHPPSPGDQSPWASEWAI